MTLFDSTYRNIYQQLKTTGKKSRDTLALINFSLDWDLKYLPLLSLRRVNLSSLVTDLLWQLSGSSNVFALAEKAFIWKEWADDAGFLESSYGRHFRKSPSYMTLIRNEKVCNAFTEKPFYHNDKFELDQFRYVVETLTHNPLSRRAIINIWNPANATIANQPPCLINLNFNLYEIDPISFELHTFVNMRSTDFGLGFVFDIMHYAMITEVIKENLSQKLSIKSCKLHFNSDNFHVYNNHIEAIDNFISLSPVSQSEPTLQVKYYDDTLNGNLCHFLEPYDFIIRGYDANDFVRLPKTIN